MMEGRVLPRRLVYVLVLIVIWVVGGCAPSLTAKYEGAEGPATATAAAPERAITQNNIVPALYSATPATTTLTEAEGFQDTLIRLYQQVNLSVVYILVGSSSSGSGFVYDEYGHIVTNNHVVTAGTRYEVVFATGDRLWATLVGGDVDSDLAVLKVDRLPPGIKPLALAPALADSVQVGQFAVAIGSPFGEQGSMSLGIVSGVGRSLPSQRGNIAYSATSTYSLPQVVQTDAPINPGNSGGPLLNLNGEVIGINAAIASTTGTNSGVGFAIPVAAIKLVVPDLIEHGEHIYSYMGATFDDEITLNDQATYGLSQTRGAYVVSVTTGSPADKAGLVGGSVIRSRSGSVQVGSGGDLIVEIDGQPINSFADLNSYLVFHTQPGQTIQITVLRNGERQLLSLTLGVRPE